MQESNVGVVRPGALIGYFPRPATLISSGFKTWWVVIRIVWIDLGRKVSRRDQSHNPFNSRCCLAAWRSERSDVLVFHLAKVVIPKRSEVLVLLCRC